MAGKKYLAIDSTTGLEKEIAATDVSAGAGNAGDVVALNSAGQIDTSMIPAGIGGVTLSLPATEAIAAGALVNIWNSSGTASVRNASATDATKPAHGFVTAAVASGATATVYGPGQKITGLSGLTPGQRQFLDTATGGLTATPPAATGNLLQAVGEAIDATSALFQPMAGVIRA